MRVVHIQVLMKALPNSSKAYAKSYDSECIKTEEYALIGAEHDKHQEIYAYPKSPKQCVTRWIRLKSETV